MSHASKVAMQRFVAPHAPSASSAALTLRPLRGGRPCVGLFAVSSAQECVLISGRLDDLYAEDVLKFQRILFSDAATGCSPPDEVVLRVPLHVLSTFLKLADLKHALVAHSVKIKRSATLALCWQLAADHVCMPA